jgi:hypothetical protein
MQSHPYPDWARSQTDLRLNCGRDGRRGRLENDEERIALRADLEAAMAGERFAKNTAVL